MTCSHIPIPLSVSPLDSFMRKHIIERIHQHLEEIKEYDSIRDCGFSPEPVKFAENVLIDDDFLSLLPSDAIKQLTAEQIENIRGRIAKRIVVSSNGKEFEISMEF
ncbi:hypothetical protein JA33_216 [Dickeya phage vB_DsoM_JA33]|uniref:Uncharacterized protein n=2 Tax=Salmondvirus JA11 TaxID=2734141 RepID=A0A386K5W3_9CAUD|nr:hypothetical protein HOU32_gp215 [Dickeya phage vB_DsoM_JA11]AXG67590.1 hypothetical protein JA33_216 [Dickeya phage vB_DsoM_JA33]AYD80020.1 hypothetical protein JA11_215 [Dickeya phage vB_DsoM_JA11]